MACPLWLTFSQIFIPSPVRQDRLLRLSLRALTWWAIFTSPRDLSSTRVIESTRAPANFDRLSSLGYFLFVLVLESCLSQFHLFAFFDKVRWEHRIRF